MRSDAPSVRVRPATAADRAFARVTHHAAYRDVVEIQFGPWDEAQQDQFFTYAWDGYPHDVLLHDEAPCGYCCVEQRDHDIHLRELVIAPEFQRRGIGTAFIQQLQQRALARHVPIVLGTFIMNRARTLYERLGFHAVDRNSTHVFYRWSPRT